MQIPHADIGVIGGSGLYEFISEPKQMVVQTPYGEPSAPLTFGLVGNRSVAFIPRHGSHHQYPPHRINYRANLWALAHAGVQQIVAACAVGGLTRNLAPGQFVVPDQLVDRTSGRDATFVESGAIHAPFADPLCAQIRAAFPQDEVAQGGAMVVIQGPRFSTRAESAAYAAAGYTLINMTAMPEAILARELGLCYAILALVTDLDAGLAEGEGVRQEEVFALFARRLEPMKQILTQAVSGLPTATDCACSTWRADLTLNFPQP